MSTVERNKKSNSNYSCIILLIMLLVSNFCVAQNFSEKYAWMIGKWELKNGHNTLIEEWKLKDDSTFLGISYKLTNEKAKQVLETIELRNRNGIYYYVPVVVDQNNGAEVRFEIKISENNKFVAENLYHDFPQRISYELKNASELQAKIEGTKNGKEKKAEWIFKKSSQKE